MFKIRIVFWNGVFLKAEQNTDNNYSVFQLQYWIHQASFEQ